MKRAAAVIYTLEDQLQSAWDAFDAEHKLCEDLTLELAAEREKSKRLTGALQEARYKILNSKIPGAMGVINRINKLLPKSKP